jgi:hypothetical protein
MAPILTQLLYVNCTRDDMENTWEGPKFDEMIAMINKHVPDKAAAMEKEKRSQEEKKAEGVGKAEKPAATTPQPQEKKKASPQQAPLPPKSEKKAAPEQTPQSEKKAASEQTPQSEKKASQEQAPPPPTPATSERHEEAAPVTAKASTPAASARPEGTNQGVKKSSSCVLL